MRWGVRYGARSVTQSFERRAQWWRVLCMAPLLLGSSERLRTRSTKTAAARTLRAPHAVHHHVSVALVRQVHVAPRVTCFGVGAWCAQAHEFVMPGPHAVTERVSLL